MDAASDPDLFWALRGGGGGYAIVTALHVELLPIAEAYAGALLFPAEVGVDGGAPLSGLGRDRSRRGRQHAAPAQPAADPGRS